MGASKSRKVLPGDIRFLRGDRSRAAFAAELGVSPLTVYRWELDVDAPEARSPRGATAGRLRGMLDAHPNRRPVSDAEVEANLAGERLPVVRALREETRTGEALRLGSVLDAVHRADFRGAETLLLAELSSGALRSRSAQALAAYAQGMVLLFGRNDAHGALGVVLPYLGDAESYGGEVAVRLHVLAAHVFASADGRLFDLGRVRSHVARAEASLREDSSADLRFVVRHAEVIAAVMSADAGLVLHTLGRSEALMSRVTEPLARALALELEGHAATFAGDVDGSCRAFRALVTESEQLGFAYAFVRATVFLALHEVDRGAAPAEVLAMVERARRWTVRSGLRPGVQALYLAAIEGDALLRAADFDAAETVLREGLALANDLAWSPVPLGMAFANLLVARGHFDELRAFGAALSTSEVRVQRSLTRAYGRFLLACADLWSDDDAHACVAAFNGLVEDVRVAGGWPFLEREALVRAYAAAVARGTDAERQLTSRASRRILEAHPSRRTSAWLVRMRGLENLKHGDANDALHLLEDARAQFAAMADTPEVLLTERALAYASRLLLREDSSDRLACSEAAFARIGLVAPRVFEVARVEAIARRASEKPITFERLRALKDSVERMSRAGTDRGEFEEELLALARRVAPAVTWRFDELDSRSDARDGASTASAWSLSPRGGRVLVNADAVEVDSEARLALEVFVAAASAVITARRAADADAATRTVSSFDAEDDPGDGFVAASPSMRALRADIRALSSSRATVLIHGESGSGKELVARAVHDASTRSTGPFATLNCAAVPRELFESQLFGHKRGAFTGATSDALGILRAADGGTVFLDEIGELPLELQPKLLRLLENSEVLPVGANRPLTVDVRVVAATHRDLLKCVSAGTFREDLFYRLQVIPLAVPPLRERPEDVVAIARAFLARHAASGDQPASLAPDAIVKLMGHAWPGNVRELRNALERAMAFAPRPTTLHAEHLRLGRA